MRSALAAVVMLAASSALAEPPAKPQAAEAKSLPANPGSCGGGAWRNPSYKPPTRDVLAKQLPANSYNVTQQEGTESPFHNAYWDNHAPGIYVDVVSGEPLFSSTDKFDSGTGWPSFTRPLAADHVTNKTDGSLFMTRTEVRSKEAGSHLGHVFDDGPQPTGLRYCINSAALRFIPATELAKAGYPEYVKLFPKATASK